MSVRSLLALGRPFRESDLAGILRTGPGKVPLFDLRGRIEEPLDLATFVEKAGPLARLRAIEAGRPQVEMIARVDKGVRPFAIHEELAQAALAENATLTVHVEDGDEYVFCRLLETDEWGVRVAPPRVIPLVAAPRRRGGVSLLTHDRRLRVHPVPEIKLSQGSQMPFGHLLEEGGRDLQVYSEGALRRQSGIWHFAVIDRLTGVGAFHFKCEPNRLLTLVGMAADDETLEAAILKWVGFAAAARGDRLQMEFHPREGEFEQKILRLVRQEQLFSEEEATVFYEESTMREVREMPLVRLWRRLERSSDLPLSIRIVGASLSAPLQGELV